MAVLHFVYAFISSWTFELFHFGAIINNAAMNIHIEVFIWTHVSMSFETIPKSRITESYGNSLLNILGNYQTVFKNSCTILHSHQQCMKVLISPHPQQHFLLSNFLITAI